MTRIDLRPLGFSWEVDVHGTVEESWSRGQRLLFLFGENHRDREMKRLNLLNACTLSDLGIVGCAGVEGLLGDVGGWTPEAIEAQSIRLFEDHRTDDGVIDYLWREQPSWYGFFEFGSTLRLLRPSLEVRCVEDSVLREAMKPIAERYELYELGATPHPSPDHPTMGDHPHNLKREAAMIENMLALWDEKPRAAPAAVLNTGTSHSPRLCGRALARGINYIYISIPVSDVSFGAG